MNKIIKSYQNYIKSRESRIDKERIRDLEELAIFPLDSKKTLKDVEENKKKALDIIIDFYHKYYKEGTINERQIKFENVEVV